MRIAIIPARGGSQRILRKNIRNFCGRPMLEWSIELARASKLFDHILVSTEDQEIATVAEAAGAQVPFVRPANLSGHHSGTVEVVAHAVRWTAEAGWGVTSACCLYPTAALTLPADLHAALEILTSQGWDYVFAAGRYDRAVQRAFVRGERNSMSLLFPEHRLTRTQDLAPVFFDAGQFYWGSTEAWSDERPIFGARSSFIELPSERAVDIDEEDDWASAEQKFRQLKRAIRENDEQL